MTLVFNVSIKYITDNYRIANVFQALVFYRSRFFAVIHYILLGAHTFRSRNLLETAN